MLSFLGGRRLGPCASLGLLERVRLWQWASRVVAATSIALVLSSDTSDMLHQSHVGGFLCTHRFTVAIVQLDSICFLLGIGTLTR